MVFGFAVGLFGQTKYPGVGKVASAEREGG